MWKFIIFMSLYIGSISCRSITTFKNETKINNIELFNEQNYYFKQFQCDKPRSDVRKTSELFPDDFNKNEFVYEPDKVVLSKCDRYCGYCNGNTKICAPTKIEKVYVEIKKIQVIKNKKKAQNVINVPITLFNHYECGCIDEKLVNNSKYNIIIINDDVMKPPFIPKSKSGMAILPMHVMSDSNNNHYSTVNIGILNKTHNISNEVVNDSKNDYYIPNIIGWTFFISLLILICILGVYKCIKKIKNQQSLLKNGSVSDIQLRDHKDVGE